MTEKDIIIQDLRRENAELRARAPKYPCVYYEKKLCKKFSKNGVTSFCVMGPCPHETPSNADRIRAMSDEELVDFLSSIAYAREMPWSLLFHEKFCTSCPTTTCAAEGFLHPLDLYECEFEDGKCPHGSDIIWWLQQPAEEVDNDRT